MAHMLGPLLFMWLLASLRPALAQHMANAAVRRVKQQMKDLSLSNFQINVCYFFFKKKKSREKDAQKSTYCGSQLPTFLKASGKLSLTVVSYLAWSNLFDSTLENLLLKI